MLLLLFTGYVCRKKNKCRIIFLIRALLSLNVGQLRYFLAILRLTQIFLVKDDVPHVLYMKIIYDNKSGVYVKIYLRSIYVLYFSFYILICTEKMTVTDSLLAVTVVKTVWLEKKIPAVREVVRTSMLIHNAVAVRDAKSQTTRMWFIARNALIGGTVKVTPSRRCAAHSLSPLSPFSFFAPIFLSHASWKRVTTIATLSRGIRFFGSYRKAR